MRQRGRPRHPDLLTPREWEVLSLVREGLSNREIGDRLGVSRDGIKYHISQILLKLGVSTREEAAAWQPAAPQPTAVASRFSRVSRIALIGVAGAVLAGVVALGGAVAYSELSGGNDSTSAPGEVLGGGPPTASPDAIPTPSPDGTLAPQLAADGSLGSVVYVKDGNLWVVDLDTGEDELLLGTTPLERLLALDPIQGRLVAEYPAWSADGQWIRLKPTLNGNPNSLTTSFLVRRSDGLFEYGGGEWSPTDLLIYGGSSVGGYFMQRPFGSFPEGSVPIAVGDIVGVMGVGDGKFSPDGNTLAVVEANPGAAAVVGLRHAHLRQPADGSESMYGALFSADDPNAPPVMHSWSPDGKCVLFWTGPGDAAFGEMMLVPVDDPAAARTIGNVPVKPANAAWSPDGSRLAFVEQLDETRTGLHILSMDGSFDEVFEGQVGGATMDVDWSPDGKTVAFSQDGHVRFVSVGLDHSGELASDPGYIDRFPRWSKDGSQVMFVRVPAGRDGEGLGPVPQVWLMNVDGTGEHKLIDLDPVQVDGVGATVDWTRYISWYRPTGLGPFATAAPPSTPIH